MLCSTEGLGRPVRGKKSICSPIYKPVKFFMAEKRKWPSKSRKLPTRLHFLDFQSEKKVAYFDRNQIQGVECRDFLYYLPFHQPNEALLMNMLLFFSFVLQCAKSKFTKKMLASKTLQTTKKSWTTNFLSLSYSSTFTLNMKYFLTFLLIF